jgi:DNA-binding CsgD family transcriptional regulator
MTKKDNTGAHFIPANTRRFFTLSHEPWGIKDVDSNYVFVNQAFFDFLEIPEELQDRLYEENYNFATPLQPIAEKLIEHDRKVMETGKRTEAVGTILVNGKYKTFILERFPRISEDEEIIGLVFHFRKFEHISMSYFVDKPFHGVATYQPPTKMFTNREWDVLFLLFRRLDKRKMSELLGISDITVRNLISRLFLKTGTSTQDQLLAMGVREGWHLYIPAKFAEIGYDILFDE